MSVEATRTRTVDSVDKYNHEIRLVDSTIPQTDKPQLTSSGSWRRLARNPTRTSFKNKISQRKYAKWQNPDKFASDADDSPRGEIEDGAGAETSTVVIEPHPDNEESNTVDFAGPTQETAAEVEEENKASKKASREKPAQEIDILYENQRGSFFCGLPLYSHSSLLPIDPSAWVTHEFKDSPVNITNAQVPDPSWKWAWKTWYVDMSHDVDEEGWQYSFMFGSNFAWHGTHPWFHSFVRRRRWLRKRVKRTDFTMGKDKEGSLEAAHHLNTDYFTIHSRQRDRSPASASNPEAVLARPVSYTSFQNIKEEMVEPDEIKDIPSLLKTLRLGHIDRVKVDAVKQFIRDGGDEIHYLPDNMSEIMSSLIFQNSRRQILEYLKDSAEKVQTHRDEHDAEERPEGEQEKRRIDNLLQAANAADQQIHGLEYWSDRKHVLQTEDDAAEDGHETTGPGRHSSVIGEIKGISEKSETSREVRADRRLVDKGKKPERSSSPKSIREEKEPAQAGLGNDSVMIPDNDEELNGSKSGS